MRINVSNVGNDLFVGPNRTIGVNAIDVEINGKKLRLPAVVPNKIETQYSQRAGIRIDTSIIQYVKRIYDISYLRNPTNCVETINEYRGMIVRNPESILDFYLQYPQGKKIKDSDREIIHDIQRKAGALILSDYETDPEQDVGVFESQVLDLQRTNPRHVVCPTLDIGMRPEGLFAKKLDVVIKNFDRFNVIYRSIKENTDKWAQLSERLYEQKVWCNVVGVSQRWFGKNMISNNSRVFLFGAHTASQGYPWIGASNAKLALLNGNSMCYDIVSRGMTYEETRSESLRAHRHQLILSRPQIINGTYYESYVPSKRGLVQTLISIA